MIFNKDGFCDTCGQADPNDHRHRHCADSEEELLDHPFMTRGQVLAENAAIATERAQLGLVDHVATDGRCATCGKPITGPNWFLLTPHDADKDSALFCSMGCVAAAKR